MTTYASNEDMAFRLVELYVREAKNHRTHMELDEIIDAYFYALTKIQGKRETVDTDEHIDDIEFPGAETEQQSSTFDTDAFNFLAP